MGGRTVLFEPALGLRHQESNRWVCNDPGVSCRRDPLGGQCAPADQFTYAPPVTGANPEGIMFNDNNPNMLKQKAIFGEASYK